MAGLRAMTGWRSVNSFGVRRRPLLSATSMPGFRAVWLALRFRRSVAAAVLLDLRRDDGEPGQVVGLIKAALEPASAEAPEEEHQPYHEPPIADAVGDERLHPGARLFVILVPEA